MRTLACAALILATPAAAVEFVVSTGKLTDDQFYNTVACGAPLDGACIDPLTRWSASNAADLRVSMEPIPGTFPKPLAARMLASLDRAIAEINGAGAALHMRRVPPGQGLIRVYLTLAGDGQPITGTGDPGVDGQIIGAGLTTVWWNNRLEITEAVIAMANGLPMPEVYPVMLEELTQSTGLLTDIRNPAYESVSVFSEDSNTVLRLGPQDIMVLRRHYP